MAFLDMPQNEIKIRRFADYATISADQLEDRLHSRSA